MRYARTAWGPAPRPAPPGHTLWAIGDVHGHLAELQALRRWIFGSTAQAAPGSMTLVHLGDYIDRGPDARGVIDELLRPVGHPAQQVFLVGNHEQFLRELIAQDPALDRAFLTGWFNNGAAQTLDSLGVAGYGRLLQANRLAELGARVTDALGPDRLRFIVDRLQPSHQVGEYLFVHAGIDPKLPLAEQDDADLLLMREPFLSHGGPWPHPFCVVHGHSIALPTVRPHRIGVDAGCYLHGALCAVEITGAQLRFWGVTQRQGFDWAERLGGGGWVWEVVGA